MQIFNDFYKKNKNEIDCFNNKNSCFNMYFNIKKRISILSRRIETI